MTAARLRRVETTARRRGQPHGRAAAAPDADAAAPCGCARRRSTSSSARSTCSAEGSALRTAIEEGRPHSMVLYGPPGTGKTTLARMLARNASAAFEEVSAVNAGPRRCARCSSAPRSGAGRAARRTIFFLDEIHRFNKAQQDALLPAVEEGLVALVGRDDREPVLRGQLGAALARAGLRAARARRRRRARAAAARARRRARHRRAPAGRGRRARVPRRALRRRRAHGAGRARAGRARRSATAR